MSRLLLLPSRCNLALRLLLRCEFSIRVYVREAATVKEFLYGVVSYSAGEVDGHYDVNVTAIFWLNQNFMAVLKISVLKK